MTTIIFYASSTGNTQAAAEYLAERLDGNAVPFSSAELVDLTAVDTAVFGSRIHAGGILKAMTEFVKRKQVELAGCKTAYFVCSLFDGEKAEKQCAKAGVQLGMETGCYFVGAKKKLKAGQTEEFDSFADRIREL